MGVSWRIESPDVTSSAPAFPIPLLATVPRETACEVAGRHARPRGLGSLVGRRDRHRYPIAVDAAARVGRQQRPLLPQARHAEGHAQDPAPLARALRRAMAAVAAADQGNAAQRKCCAQRSGRAARAYAACRGAHLGIHRHPGRSEHDGRHARALERTRRARASLASARLRKAFAAASTPRTGVRRSPISTARARPPSCT